MRRLPSTSAWTHTIRTTYTLHHERPCRRRIQRRQFLSTEPLRHNPGPKGNQEQNDDWKPNSCNGLGDRKCCAKAKQLNCNKHPYSQTTFNPFQWVGWRSQLSILREKEELQSNAVACQSLAAHHEEQSRQHTLGYQMQNNQQRARHGDEKQQSLCEVADTLFDDVIRCSGDLALVGLVGIRDKLADAEAVGVERCLRNEAVGEWNAEDAGDEGGQAEQEDVPMESGGFAQGKFGALRDEGGDWEILASFSTFQENSLVV